MSTTPPVTIFIHGTVPPQPILTIPLVDRFFRCPSGITSLQELPESHTKDILTPLSDNHPKEFPAEHWYAFGWPGFLNHDGRKKAAHELYKGISNLKKTYERNGLAPHFKLITHSHGGNVALWLAYVAEKYDNPADIKIDELILLACPVQAETAPYSSADIFKKVYSIYSNHDLLQIIDPQGLHAFFDRLNTYGLDLTLAHLKELGPLFSERQFPKHIDVLQLNVKYPHREFLHIEFLLPQFMQALPTLLQKMKNTSSTDKQLVHVFREENA